VPQTRVSCTFDTKYHDIWCTAMDHKKISSANAMNQMNSFFVRD